MHQKLFLAALAATTVFATPAFAQVASATAEARGLVLQPLTLTRVDHLDFGTVVASAVAGTVSINADTGARAVTGGVTGVPTFPGNRARFDGAGTAGQTVLLTVTPPTGNVIVSGANSITVTSMALDAGGGLTQTRTIAAGGVFQVYVGGNFAIAANQPNGLYAANFTVTADYQ